MSELFFDVYSPPAAVPIRSIGAPLAYVAPRTNTVLPAPSTIVDGDLLLALFAVVDFAAHETVTPPAGFSLLTGYPITYDNGGVAFARMYAYSKIASGESGNYTFTHAEADAGSEGIMFALHNHAGTPFDPNPSTNTEASTQSPLALSVTTVNDGSRVFYFAANLTGWHAGADGPSGSTPTFTEHLGDPAGLLYISSGMLTPAGATGNKSVTTTASASASGASLIAVKRS